MTSEDYCAQLKKLLFLLEEDAYEIGSVFQDEHLSGYRKVLQIEQSHLQQMIQKTKY